MSKKNKTIIFSGGGTGGSVTPLLAVIKELEIKHPDWNILWFGSTHGIEIDMVKKEGIKYYPILSGKFRRYFSLKNILDIFNILAAFIQAFIYLLIIKPKVVLSAGSFVSVPIAWAAWLLRIPALSHQQDLRVGLANKLMAPVSKQVTVTFAKSLEDYGSKATLTGNPVRKEFKKLEKNKEKLLKKYNLKTSLPLLVVLGGGTGAKGINDLVFKSFASLKGKVQVVHITGNKKQFKLKDRDYHSYDFLDAEKIAELLYLADLVVSRCGLGLITELSYLAKPAIFIPMPSSHQEDNANYIAKHKAGIVLEQYKTDADEFSQTILKLLKDEEKKVVYKQNLYDLVPKEASEKIIKTIKKYVK